MYNLKEKEKEKSKKYLKKLLLKKTIIYKLKTSILLANKMYNIPFMEPLTAIVMIICGLIGFLYSGDSIISAIPFLFDKKNADNKILKYLDVIMGIVAGAWLTILILDEQAQFRWLTILLFVLFMIVSFAHPLKHLDGPALILLVIPFIVIAAAAFIVKDSRYAKSYTFFGTTIALWVLLTIVALIMLIFLLIVFFVTEIVVNPILYIIGWAPLLFVVCLLVLIQGVLLLIFPINGALQFL